jgi:hypothetical protein
MQCHFTAIKVTEVGQRFKGVKVCQLKFIN